MLLCLLLPAGGAGLPEQRPRCLHDGFLRLPVGRSRARANRSTADPEGNHHPELHLNPDTYCREDVSCVVIYKVFIVYFNILLVDDVKDQCCVFQPVKDHLQAYFCISKHSEHKTFDDESEKTFVWCSSVFLAVQPWLLNIMFIYSLLSKKHKWLSIKNKKDACCICKQTMARSRKERNWRSLLDLRRSREVSVALSSFFSSRQTTLASWKEDALQSRAAGAHTGDRS